MTPQATLQLLQTQLAKHHLTEKGWTGKLDHAKRRFGLCSPSKKTISISRHLAALNPHLEVLDTILHEIAHALAFEQYRTNCGHDPRWQAIAQAIGARPQRCYNPQTVSQPPGKWQLIHQHTGEVFHTYHRKPNRDLKTTYIKGQKQHTLGQLVLRRLS
ncbi:MAG: SprT-like domain-containing protein [Verrucomicrobiota bacterium]